MKIPFKRGNILLPKNTDMTKWSVVACDQYTSEPEYWNSVREIVGSNPSTLNLTLPEIYLEESDVEERIKKYQLEPGRADVIFAGATILHRFLLKTNRPEMMVSTKGVRYGVALEALSRII